MDMYPDNQELSLQGKKVMWPGVDASGKFTNGDFTDPLVPPSFIPAETINLILDNLSGLIKRLGGTPDNTSVTQLADAIDRRFIQIFRNGYIQWPGMPSPLEDTSLRFEGYSWYEVNYRGNFFRAKGDKANPFSSIKFTREQIKNGDYVFQAEEQGDAIRNITGQTAKNSEGQLRNRGSNFEMEGAFYGEPEYGTTHGDGGYTSAYVNLKFDASRVVPTAAENRPRNLTFTLWTLLKDDE